MRYSELLQYGSLELAGAGIEDAEIDARLLLESASGLDRTSLYLQGSSEAEKNVITVYNEYVRRRKRREPVAYILGEWEFWSLPLYVSPAVLIPRPETEQLVEMSISRSLPENRGRILDLCTGSGAIAVALAVELKNSAVFACDISAAAIEVAKKNIERHLPRERVKLVQGNLLFPFAEKSFSLVVSNPPYVMPSEISHQLQPEVRDYEPRIALDGGGEDGLDIIRMIERHLRYTLIPGGECFMEFGALQGKNIVEIFTGIYWQNIEIIKDYSGHDRILHVQKHILS